MLVAFLYDLKIRKESGGQTTLADRYRDLFKGRFADGSDGNEAIIRVLGSTPVYRDFMKSYVESITTVELPRVLSVYGLAVTSTAKGSQLQVERDLSEDQKQLLRSLGYQD